MSYRYLPSMGHSMHSPPHFSSSSSGSGRAYNTYNNDPTPEPISPVPPQRNPEKK